VSFIWNNAEEPQLEALRARVKQGVCAVLDTERGNPTTTGPILIAYRNEGDHKPPPENDLGARKQV
jgi:hypothetical protein